MAFVTVAVNWRSLQFVRPWLVGTLILVVVLGAAAASYLVYTELERQRAEIVVLVRDLAATKAERDDLQLHSDQLSDGLERANLRIAGLQTDLELAHGDIARMEDEADVLRDRIQVA